MKGNIAAYQMYKRAADLLLEAQKLEFPPEQWYQYNLQKLT